MLNYETITATQVIFIASILASLIIGIFIGQYTKKLEIFNKIMPLLILFVIDKSPKKMLTHMEIIDAIEIKFNSLTTFPCSLPNCILSMREEGLIYTYKDKTSGIKIPESDEEIYKHYHSLSERGQSILAELNMPIRDKN